MANFLNCKELSDKLCEQIKSDVADLNSMSLYPHICMINVKGDQASEIYIRNKKKMADYVGIKSTIIELENNVKHEVLSKTIKQLNDDKTVHGILLQLPLPAKLSPKDFIDLIDPSKDVDGLTTINQGRLFSGTPGLYPCTPLGIMHILRHIHGKLDGMRAVVLGRSSIVGRPTAMLLLHANCTVTSVHSYSKNLPDICKTADILIAAVGKPHFVNDTTWIKNGATIIDVGMNRFFENDKPKLVGDVDADLVSDVAGVITPVPGGVGLMTVSYLMYNTLNACKYYS